jgi:hypothetical protein
MHAVGVKLDDDLPVQLGVNDSNAALVLVAVLVCVIAPMAEEFFFRGFLFGALRGYMKLWPAALNHRARVRPHPLQARVPRSARRPRRRAVPALRADRVAASVHRPALAEQLAPRSAWTQGWTWQIPLLMNRFAGDPCGDPDTIVRRAALSVA